MTITILSVTTTECFSLINTVPGFTAKMFTITVNKDYLRVYWKIQRFGF